MTLPPRNLAHLDCRFAAWLQLACRLIEAGARDDRFIVLPSELPADRLLTLLQQARVLRADLIEEPGLGDQSLLVVYQDRVREADRYLQLAGSRFMLEVSLDAAQQPIDLRLVIFLSERSGMPYPLAPWGGTPDDMVAFFQTGQELPVIELE